LRNGLGFDLHRFEEGGNFILGVFCIPFTKGFWLAMNVLLILSSDAILAHWENPI
jgi:2C-methyl-D-erythritol 2,4-cyclodiphosphate synthase